MARSHSQPKAKGLRISGAADGARKGLKFDAPVDQNLGTLQVAPMVDIVFLLICFFMLAAQLVQGQKDPAVALPRMASPMLDAETPAEVTLNLRADGQVTVDAQVVALRAIPGLLADEMARARDARRPLRVVVRADRRQRFAAMDELLEACRQAGVSQVGLRAVEEGGS